MLTAGWVKASTSGGAPAGRAISGLRPSASRRERIRWASSPAALRVKVSPSTSSGRTNSFATSQSTRAAIVSVLPEPAPATTSAGASGASITARCSSVGRCWPIASAIASALMRGCRPGRGGMPAPALIAPP